jgi:ferredoxin-nitrite reductase
VKVSKAAGEPHGIGEGVYFRAQLAGITGHQQFAKDSGILIAPREVVAVAAAMIRVFSENADRTNRKKARLKYLLDKWGFEKFVEETGKKLAFPIRHFPLELCEPRHPPIKHSHLGVYRQFQTGMNYVGPAIPVGRMKAWQMHRLAEVAERYGSGELRLTVFQNLILPNVADTAVENVKRALVRLGFEPRASAIAGGLVACTGSKGCKYAATNTKEDAITLVRALEEKLQLDLPINIHFTGCPHSCAQHYMGDIGLIGTKVGANSEEGYHVVLGGGFDHEQGVGREIFRGISVQELPSLLEKILSRYQARRKKGESFVEFTRRHEVGQLQELFS